VKTRIRSLGSVTITILNELAEPWVRDLSRKLFHKPSYIVCDCMSIIMMSG
jgi:hypothetical protein